VVESDRVRQAAGSAEAVTPLPYLGAMRWWEPSPDEAELFDWWRPLLAASRHARDEKVYWPIHVDEFAFTGRVERRPRPAIWVYEHRRSGRELLVDAEGRTYKFVVYRSGRRLGRFAEIDVRAAIWRACLPDVVEPIWYDEPRPAPVPLSDGTWTTSPTSRPASTRRCSLPLGPGAHPGGATCA
jgi:hypothetical protein